MVDQNTVIVKAEEVVLAQLDGKVVMMSIENGQYYGLDEIGSIIWEKIIRPIEFKHLIAQLVAEYDVPREKCEKDVAVFLKNLYEKKLIDLR